MLFLKLELKDYALSFSSAFHHLKKVCRGGVIIGKNDFLNRLREDAQLQYIKARCTVDLISSIISATGKSDILNKIEKLNCYIFKYEDENSKVSSVRGSLREFKEFYEALDDINLEQKSTLIENCLYSICHMVYTFPDECVIAYSMYKDDYEYYYKKYEKIYKRIFEIKRKHREIYYNVHTMNLHRFQYMVQNTMLSLFLESHRRTDRNMKE